MIRPGDFLSMFRGMDVASINGHSVPCVFLNDFIETLETATAVPFLTVAAERVSSSEVNVFSKRDVSFPVKTGDEVLRIKLMTGHPDVGPYIIRSMQPDTSGYTVLVLEPSSAAA